MPITGKFEADFSQFVSATKDATTQLDQLKSTSTQTAQQITAIETASKGAATALQGMGGNWAEQADTIKVTAGAVDSFLASEAAASAGTIAALVPVVGQWVAVGTVIYEATSKALEYLPQVDQAIARTTASVMGYGDASKAVSDAQQTEMQLAADRWGREVTNIEQARKLNQQFADDLKKYWGEVVAARDKLWLSEAQEHQAIAALNDAQYEGVRADLARGASVNEVMLAWNASYAAVMGVKDALKQEADERKADLKVAQDSAKAEVKAAQDRAAAIVASQDELDAQLTTAYGREIKLAQDAEAQRAVHYGTDTQIQMLQQLKDQLHVAEQANLALITSEKDRQKVEYEYNRAAQQIDAETAKLRQKQTDDQAQATLRTIQLQTQLNATYGEDAREQLKLTGDALTTYTQKINDLNATIKDDSERTTAVALANRQLEQSLYDTAVAQDKATAAFQAGAAAAKAAADAATLTASQYAAQRASGGISGQLPTALSPEDTDRYNASLALQSAFGMTGIQSAVPGRQVNAANTFSWATGVLGSTPSPPNMTINVDGSVWYTSADLGRAVQTAVANAYTASGSRVPA